MHTAALPAALGLLLSPPVARADDVPDWFVAPEDCPTRPCACEDGPMMEVFLASQQDAREAWASVRADILGGSGPTSGADAIASFQSRFGGDPRVADQFRTCEGYDPEVNSLSKIAGVTPWGRAALDPCYCDAFCSDIVQSTVAHEVMHVPTLVGGLLARGDMVAACGIGIVSGYLCDILVPLVLAESEVASHDAGIRSLDASVKRLVAKDPSNPELECTWEPLGPPPANAAPQDLPDGLLDRLRLLGARVLHGATP